MEPNYIIVARAFVTTSPNAPTQQNALGQLGIVRTEDGVTPFLSNNRKGADIYADWMRQHFGNEATYEVIEIRVNI